MTDIVRRLRAGWRVSDDQRLEADINKESVEAADEIERLRSLIGHAAKYWLDHFLTNPAIAWEGGIDKAMKAACEEIERLRAENAKLREVLTSIALQNLYAEVVDHDPDDLDWLGGYEGCVKEARAALAKVQP